MRLEVCDVTFSYGSRPVLDEVNLGVNTGEILGLVGPNGSGKSTLLQCINRILIPDGGTAVVNGDDLGALSREGVARRVGYVPQDEAEAFPSTVFDTILMGRKPHVGWRPGEDDLDLVGDIVELLGLSEFTMRPIDEISGGQRQKVLVGRALAQEADVLLLDEPTSSLDLRHQLEVMDLIAHRVQTEDMAAVMAIHDLNLAARYCNKVVMLHDQEIFAAGGSDVLNPENIRTVYDVKVRVEDAGDRRIIVPERSVAPGPTPAGTTPKSSDSDSSVDDGSSSGSNQQPTHPTPDDTDA